MTARENRTRSGARSPARRDPDRSPPRLRITTRGRLVLLSLFAVAALVVVVLAGGIGSASPTASSPARLAAPAAPAPPAATSVSSTTPAAAASGPSPLALNTIRQGRLPQTHVYPGGRNQHLTALMEALWAGVAHDSLSTALPAFFPKGAYLQLKAIYSAGSDWTDRLVHDYGLDIHAAHVMLGSGAARAHFIAIDVPTSFGHWVEPGVCYNSIGYYEMPNARVVYWEAGREHSFGIASLISWRGVWYVVHLGAILRPEEVGLVDQPEAGRGVSEYSGTC